jgi:hypothetical protein
MKGSIRAIVGFLLVYGCVGGMDNSTDTILYTTLLPLSIVGLGIMASGVNAMKGIK